MAGRGCTITVKLLSGGTSEGEAEDISLTVALHSPLEVLKDELAELTGIAREDQVLILCDLNDPDRNSDLLLVGRDHMPLRQIGIAQDSVLTLHPLGITAEQRLQILRDTFARKKSEVQERPTFTLETAITPNQADHSYNGIIFDVECNGPYEIDLVSVNVGGMLGRVRVFARDRPWRSQAPVSSSPDRWWAHREGLSSDGWELVADIHCRPSWDRPLEIKFNKPVKLLPRQKRALYCHSSLPDDLGIQYQSYRQSDVVAQDQYITLLPGLGHTGSVPFDDRHGWYRSYRGLAGGIKYYAKWKGWNMREHSLFPRFLREAVKTMILCSTRSASDPNRSLISKLSSHCSNNLSSAEPQSSSSSGTMTMTVSPDLPQPTRAVVHRLATCYISSLPKDIVIYILEFMNFDWYRELEMTDLMENGSPPRSTRKKNTLSRGFIHALGGMQPHNFISTLLHYLQNSDGEIEIVDEEDGDDEEDGVEMEDTEDDEDEEYIPEEEEEEEDYEDEERSTGMLEMTIEEGESDFAADGVEEARLFLGEEGDDDDNDYEGDGPDDLDIYEMEEMIDNDIDEAGDNDLDDDAEEEYDEYSDD